MPGDESSVADRPVAEGRELSASSGLDFLLLFSGYPRAPHVATPGMSTHSLPQNCSPWWSFPYTSCLLPWGCWHGERAWSPALPHPAAPWSWPLCSELLARIRGEHWVGCALCGPDELYWLQASGSRDDLLMHTAAAYLAFHSSLCSVSHAHTLDHPFGAFMCSVRILHTCPVPQVLCTRPWSDKESLDLRREA